MSGKNLTPGAPPYKALEHVEDPAIPTDAMELLADYEEAVAVYLAHSRIPVATEDDETLHLIDANILLRHMRFLRLAVLHRIEATRTYS